jgi:hypothetical protein
MNLSNAGASVAVALAAIGINRGMPLRGAVRAAEGVLGAVQRDALGQNRLLGDVEVRTVVMRMSERVADWEANGPAPEEDPDPVDTPEDIDPPADKKPKPEQANDKPKGPKK